MIDDYFNDLAARIGAGSGLSGRVTDTVRTNATGGLVRDNYVVLYSPVALDVPQTRFTQVQTFDDVVEFEADVRVVGVNPQAVRRMLGDVFRQVIGYRVVAPGRQPAKVTLGSQGKVREDQSVKPFLYFVDASIEWTSHPA